MTFIFTHSHCFSSFLSSANASSKATATEKDDPDYGTLVIAASPDSWSWQVREGATLVGPFGARCFFA